MCLSVMCKYIFLDRAAVDEASPQHIDIWSLSSSLVVVHVVPNVLLASVVGVPQSAYTAQGILGALEERVVAERVEGGVRLVDAKLREWKRGLGRLTGEARDAVIREIVGFNREELVQAPPEWQGRLETTWHPENNSQKLALKNAQVTEGAVPNFRPYRLGRQPDEESGKKGWTRYVIAAFLTPSWIGMLAVVIVSVPSIGATVLATHVPPEGMNCRAFIKLLMVGTYWGQVCGADGGQPAPGSGHGEGGEGAGGYEVAQGGGAAAYCRQDDGDGGVGLVCPRLLRGHHLDNSVGESESAGMLLPDGDRPGEGGVFSEGYVADCIGEDDDGVSWHLVWAAGGDCGGGLSAVVVVLLGLKGRLFTGGHAVDSEGVGPGFAEGYRTNRGGYSEDEGDDVGNGGRPRTSSETGPLTRILSWLAFPGILLLVDSHFFTSMPTTFKHKVSKTDRTEMPRFTYKAARLPWTS